MFNEHTVLVLNKGVHVQNKLITEAHEHNHYCHGKATSITYSGCVTVTFVIQHTNYTCLDYTVICGLYGSTIFLSILINGMIFFWGGRVTEHKMCILLLSTTFVWNTSHYKNNSARHHKCMSSRKVPIVPVRFQSKLNLFLVSNFNFLIMEYYCL